MRRACNTRLAVRLTFYNDNEKYVAEWLRNLVLTCEISQGDVSEQSIADLEAWQLAGYDRVHMFAGIGGWDYALKLAGWPEDLPVWTGSCPCQPFSVAGKRKGVNDERHLWPYFFNLISQCKPPIVFGEQVASADGRKWLAGVFADLEALGYAVAGADLCAASVGAPHIRQRLYWLANAESKRRCGRAKMEAREISQLGGSGEDILSTKEHAGCGSTLIITDVCSPSYGVPARVGKLCAYGNAIVPKVAATFIRAAMETLSIV